MPARECFESDIRDFCTFLHFGHGRTFALRLETCRMLQLSDTLRSREAYSRFIPRLKPWAFSVSSCNRIAVASPDHQTKPLGSDRVVIDTVVDQIRERRAAPQLHRESAILERETGIELSRSTLDGWVMRVGELLGLIAAALRPWDKNCSKAIISRQTGRRSRWICRCMMQTTMPTLAIQSPGGT